MCTTVFLPPPGEDRSHSVKTYHKSLQDFVESPERCGELYLHHDERQTLDKERFRRVIKEKGPHTSVIESDREFFVSHFLHRLPDGVARFLVNDNLLCDARWWIDRFLDATDKQDNELGGGLFIAISRGRARTGTLNFAVIWQDSEHPEALAFAWRQFLSSFYCDSSAILPFVSSSHSPSQSIRDTVDFRVRVQAASGAYCDPKSMTEPLYTTYVYKVEHGREIAAIQRRDWHCKADGAGGLRVEGGLAPRGDRRPGVNTIRRYVRRAAACNGDYVCRRSRYFAIGPLDSPYRLEGMYLLMAPFLRSIGVHWDQETSERRRLDNGLRARRWRQGEIFSDLLRQRLGALNPYQPRRYIEIDIAASAPDCQFCRQ
ncbi:hypothetical protein DFP72DRAFT_1116669 [Ephemerocybe angulata]|uniref:Uncharacterized protein n=1 Tax=Ephemerocybe angulata TaxID=980116 RepID=A0A8H6I0K3_9AGAR|nr:hypothetical protein DFP72DRAFT_1116669 [Tulosesus angulatus]